MEDGWDNKMDKENGRTEFLKSLCERVAEVMKVEALDEETIRMVERIVVLRVSTKHINIWARQLEMKRKEIGELAVFLNLKWAKEEIETEK